MISLSQKGLLPFPAVDPFVIGADSARVVLLLQVLQALDRILRRGVFQCGEHPGLFLLGKAQDGAVIAHAALRGTGAAFCFPGAISPSVLGAWLNMRAPEGGQAQWYVLAQEEDGVTLYLAGEQFSAAKTALPAQSLTAQLETAVPDGSFFAFEAGQEPYAALDGLSLISAQSAQVSTGQSANPCDARFISALAAQIGINPYGDARFVDNDGTTSFTETNLSLRVSAQGQILLQVLQADPRFQSASLDENVLKESLGDDYELLNLTGCTREEILYMISSGCGVVVKTGANESLLLTGYDIFGNSWLYNPATGETTALSDDDSDALFAQNGNVFISYIKKVKIE